MSANRAAFTRKDRASPSAGRAVNSPDHAPRSTFRIYLPRAQGLATDGPVVPTSELPRGNEPILLVKDDDQVRALATRLLQQQGYRVTACRDGREALDAAGRRDVPFDLLMTDVIMPGMNGRELAEAIAATRPGIGVLYTSGYTANVIVQQGVLADVIAFLAKPYTAHDLARRVRDVIDSRG